MTSNHPPTAPCWAIFRGVRYSTRPGTVESIHEPVKVFLYRNPAMPGRYLAVALAGKARIYPLTAFAGEWTPIAMACPPAGAIDELEPSA